MRSVDTPGTRDRYVDLLRVLAIATVVVGHWLVIAVGVTNGRLGGRSLLAVLDWTHPLTWVAQVMPLFFLVGGYANAASWRSARGHGLPWWGWLALRAGRLLRPTTAFVSVAAVGAVTLRLAGLDPAAVAQGAWLVGIPLWFLAVYLAVVALTPVTLALHERYGEGSVLVLGAAVAVVDAVRLGAGVPAVGVVNYLLVWVAICQLGYGWRDGALLRPRVPAALAVAGAAALLGLVTIGPYPVSMVAVPGEAVSNTAPPSLALLALAVTQTGIALLLRGPGTRMCARPWVWAATVAGNRVVMSLYLWHLVPVVAAAALLYPTGVFPSPAIGTAAWYALRPLWLAVLVVLFAPLLVAVARFERPSTVSRSLRPPGGPWRAAEVAAAEVAAAAVLAACAGLVVLTVRGLGSGWAGVPVAGLLPYAAGVALFRLLAAWTAPPAPGRG
ncbi:MAG TPA: acyltransferase [Mycobacteriales bacterium]|nr:acyltransferase [Mycobacteriales bacterium]